MIDYRKLTEEAFAQHWRLQLEAHQPISPDQARLAEELTKLGYMLSLENPRTASDVPSQPDHAAEADGQGIAASVSVKLDDYQWTAASPEFRSRLITELNLVDGKYQLSESTAITTCKLDWYANYELVRLSDAAWENPRLRLYYLSGPASELLRLNGTSPAIHEVNAKAPIQLTAENVLSYLVFFCFFVRGEEGPFLILESIDNSVIDDYRAMQVNQQLKETTLAVIEGTASPASLLAITEEGNYHCSAVIHYSNAIFKAQFSVMPSGMIEMLEDEPIAADMPFRVDAPLT